MKVYIVECGCRYSDHRDIIAAFKNEADAVDCALSQRTLSEDGWEAHESERNHWTNSLGYVKVMEMEVK